MDSTIGGPPPIPPARLDEVEPDRAIAADEGPEEWPDEVAGALEPLLGYLSVVARKLVADDAPGPEGPSDLVQGTVAAALDGIAKGRAPRTAGGELKAWLRGIMLNVRRQRWRRTSRPGPAAGDHLVADTSSPSSKASRRELVERMAQARDLLGERDRQILDAIYREGLTLEAIGRRLGVSAVAVHKAHHRALGRLEDAFLNAVAVDRHASGPPQLLRRATEES